MKYIAPYVNGIEDSNVSRIISVVNETLAPLENIINHRLSSKSIKEECDFLNRVESMIPPDLQLQLHLNMILDGSREKISNYNRNLARGRNQVIEHALKVLPTSDSREIKESFDSLFESFKSSVKDRLILEQGPSAIPTDASSISAEYGKDFEDMMKNIKTPDDIPGRLGSEEEGSLMSILKMLWLGLTEEGSGIGVFQFLLDIVGLVGDFFGPVGLIADVINGIIYLFRGKYMLALISFIAAMIPFAGNVLKGFLQTSKVAAPIMEVGAIYLSAGSKTGAKVTDDAAKAIAKASPESLKALEYISKKSKEAMTGLSGFITKFFDKFLAKAVSWIPFIGKPLEKFFRGASDVIAAFSSRVSKFSDDIPKAITKAEADAMGDFFKYAGKEGSEIAMKGGDLVVTTSKGKTATIAADLLKGTDFMIQRYGKGFGGKMQKALKKLEMSSADFYKSLDSGLKAAEKSYGRELKIADALVSFGRKVPLFIGREVYKFLSDWKKGNQELSDSEYEFIGIGAMSDLAQDRIDRALEENPNAVWDAPIIDALEDNKAYEATVNTLNGYAEAFNLPKIGVVGYYAGGEKDKRPDEVTKFYEDLYAGDTQALDQMMADFPAFESSSAGLRYIKPFSQFV